MGSEMVRPVPCCKEPETHVWLQEEGACWLDEGALRETKIQPGRRETDGEAERWGQGSSYVCGGCQSSFFLPPHL